MMNSISGRCVCWGIFSSFFFLVLGPVRGAVVEVAKPADPTQYALSPSESPSIPSQVTAETILLDGARLHGAEPISQQKVRPTSGIVSPRPEPIVLPRPSSPAQPSELTTCQDITRSGVYTESQNLTGGSGCLSIHNTQNVVLDCQGGQLMTTSPGSAITISNARRVTIKNCVMPGNVYPALEILGSAQVQVINCRITKVDVENSNHCLITGNSITGFYQQYKSSFMTIEGNTIQVPNNEGGVSGGVISSEGAYNIVKNNHIDGGWDGDLYDENGADDGIGITDESHDQIIGNQISHTWNAGFETAGFFRDSVLADNDISYVEKTGLASYYDTSWTGNIIRNNTVENTRMMIDITYNKRVDPPDQTIYFNNNQFIGNTFSSPKHVLRYFDSAIYLDFSPEQVKSHPVVLQNNVFTNNILSQPAVSGAVGRVFHRYRVPGPYINPPDAVINGGGNICPAGSDAVICSPNVSLP